MSAACWNIAGIITSLIGVLMLFRYGMPYRTRRGGAGFLMMEHRDETDIREEQRYDRIGWVGVALVVGGAILQIVASLTPT